MKGHIIIERRVNGSGAKTVRDRNHNQHQN